MAAPARAAPIVIDCRGIIGRGALAKCGKAISEREHYVPRNGIILAILDIAGVDGAAYVLTLMQQVVNLGGDGGSLVFQELV